MALKVASRDKAANLRRTGGIVRNPEWYLKPCPEAVYGVVERTDRLIRQARDMGIVPLGGVVYVSVEEAHAIEEWAECPAEETTFRGLQVMIAPD